MITTTTIAISYYYYYQSKLYLFMSDYKRYILCVPWNFND